MRAHRYIASSVIAAALTLAPLTAVAAEPLKPGHSTVLKSEWSQRGDTFFRSDFVLDALPVGGTVHLGFEARKTATGRVSPRAHILPSGAVNVLVVDADGRIVAHERTGLRLSPGQRLSVEAEILGDSVGTVSVRAWLGGSARPDWQVRASAVNLGSALGTSSSYAYTDGAVTNNVAVNNDAYWQLAAPFVHGWFDGGGAITHGTSKNVNKASFFVSGGECSIDGGAWGTCGDNGTSFTLRGLAAGEHSVRMKDARGDISALTFTVTDSPTKPTTKPTATPTTKPTVTPTAKPTTKPTARPTTRPTAKPTTKPTATPTTKPTTKPTAKPTTKPQPSPKPSDRTETWGSVKPEAKNTGTPAGVKLQRMDGSEDGVDDGILRINTAKNPELAHLDRKDIQALVVVERGNVVITQSRVEPKTSAPSYSTGIVSLPHNKARYAKLTIRDTTLQWNGSLKKKDSRSANTTGLKGANITAERLHIRNVSDGVNIDSGPFALRGSLVEDGFFSVDKGQRDGVSHNDAVQIASGKNITLEGNTLRGFDGAGLMVSPVNGLAVKGVFNLRVSKNWMDGGSCTINAVSKGKPLTGVAIKDNKFGLNQKPTVDAKGKKRPSPCAGKKGRHGVIHGAKSPRVSGNLTVDNAGKVKGDAHLMDGQTWKPLG